MALEETLASWAGPSSDSEQDRQERTERMIREAVAGHPPFSTCSLSVYAKGSYANNTNVRTDSDVDIAVECTDVEYWEESESGAHPAASPYAGPWTPEKLRKELGDALASKFPGQVDASGSTALGIRSGSARVDADVVPCFSYGYYLPSGVRRGTKIFTRSGAAIVNYPCQQLANGRSKNTRTGYAFKKVVRILKRVENAMARRDQLAEQPSYFVECLVYNCPDNLFHQITWTSIVREVLLHMWNSLQGDEPLEESQRWLEVNDYFFLFHPQQKWSRADGRAFAQRAWDYLELGE